MPLIRIVCPHCEHSVEVQTTSVTRSRECPDCGKPIIMQVASRDRKGPLKAVLTPAADALPEDAASGHEPPEDEPKSLGGDPWDRMRHDPEVQSRMLLLKLGVSFIVASIVIVVVGDFFRAQPRLGAVTTRITRALDGNRPNPEPGPGPSDPAIPKTVNPAEKKTAPPPAEPPPVTPTGPQLTDQQSAKKAVAQFLAARDVSERVRFVRDRMLNEHRMRDYYARHGDGPVAFDRIEPVEVLNPLTYSFNVILADGTRRTILVGKSRSGEYLVDWASFVVYSEMEWNEFRAKRPSAATMFRVFAGPGDFFGNEFTDKDSLVCLKLVNPLDPAAPPLFGYATKDSAVGRVLQQVLAKGGGEPRPVMLKLSYPESRRADNQVWVSEFIGEEWVGKNW